MSFQKFNLSESLMSSIHDLGYTEPTEIQKKAIPYLMESQHDFVGQAQTGTGKTAAFLLPLLQRLNPKKKHIQALILTPTRELAHQVFQEFEKFSNYLPYKGMTIYGGVPYSKQLRMLKNSEAQVIVGTPGRLIDLIDRGAVKLDQCQHLIIDEADEMLNMGFIEDVQTIIGCLPEHKRMWMFSATMPKPIIQLVEEKFTKPKQIKIKNKTLSNESIDQYYCVLERKNFLKGLRIVCESSLDLYGIVFCETREETKRYAEILIDKGIKALALHGDLNQSQRDYTMNMFKAKKISVLVCTDVASRGIDVSHITHVFNIGLPRQKESYVHRIGRTGRAGETGVAINFITPSDARKLKDIEKHTGQKMARYQLPKPHELKKIKVLAEIGKMQGIKEAVMTKDGEFKLDDSYGHFKSYLKDLSKDQILKMMFSYYFKKDMRRIDDSLDITSLSLSTAKPKTVFKRRRRSRRRKSF